MDTSEQSTVDNILTHMYMSVVVGCVRSISLAARMSQAGNIAMPRMQPLLDIYVKSGASGQEFYAAVASVVEFTVFFALDFLENYNRFDQESNAASTPRLSINYVDEHDGRENVTTITQFESSALARRFKIIASSPEIRKQLEKLIESMRSEFL